MATLDPSVLLAMGAVVVMLGGASLYVKYKLRQIDRSIAEREAAEASANASSPNPR